MNKWLTMHRPYRHPDGSIKFDGGLWLLVWLIPWGIGILNIIGWLAWIVTR